jgi:hypothetical protein
MNTDRDTAHPFFEKPAFPAVSWSFADGYHTGDKNGLQSLFDCILLGIHLSD